MNAGKHPKHRDNCVSSIYQDTHLRLKTSYTRNVAVCPVWPHQSQYLCLTTSEGGTFSWLVPLCSFPGFVELNHKLTSFYPRLSANATSGPRGCFRHPEECEGAAIHRIEDASSWMYFRNSERICKKLVSPGNLSSPHCTHTHTFFRNPARVTASVSGPVKKKKRKTCTWTARKE